MHSVLPPLEVLEVTNNTYGIKLNLKSFDFIPKFLIIRRFNVYGYNYPSGGNDNWAFNNNIEKITVIYNSSGNRTTDLFF